MSILLISNGIYIIDLATFIRLFSSKIKNHANVFCDMDVVTFLINATIDYSNNYICH